MRRKHSIWLAMAAMPLLITACRKDDDMPSTSPATITVENVLDSKPLVESGTFKGSSKN